MSPKPSSNCRMECPTSEEMFFRLRNAHEVFPSQKMPFIKRIITKVGEAIWRLTDRVQVLFFSSLAISLSLHQEMSLTFENKAKNATGSGGK